jgi:hypothetical protein
LERSGQVIAHRNQESIRYCFLLPMFLLLLLVPLQVQVLRLRY